jgi:DNA primase
MLIPRLHPDTIEDVKHRADIVDVISDYVVLRKRGKDFVGLCPFHEERTPSFVVSQTKQLYHCFGCDISGNAIKFLMELEKRQFSDVVLHLAQRYQIPIKTLEPEQRQELQRQLSLRDQLYEILACAAQFYQHALRQSLGQKAMEYLRSDRQLGEATIQQFGLGYAPVGWETLYRYLIETKRYPVTLVEKAGLIKPRKDGNSYYDVFRDRLMIPIRDVQGRVIAFGGRTLTDEQPKYLNSPETELFHKGKTLFALDQAKEGINKLDQAVVVEGYFDAIALHAVGINYVVASLGTALSLEQVKLLLRYSESKQLVLNFDADSAGTNATEKAIGEIAALAYKGEVNLKILNLPQGKDADEYLRSHSPADYQKLLDQAPLWLDWQIQQMISDRDLRQATDFQQVMQQMIKLLQKIANSDARNYYISYCAEILSLGDTRLISLRIENILAQLTPIKTPIPLRRSAVKSQHTSKLTLVNTERGLLEDSEALLLKIYLHCPEQRQLIIAALELQDLEFSLSHHRLLWQQIAQLPIEDTNLISSVQNRYLELGEELDVISHLFYLNEKNTKDIMRTPLVIQTTLACMEIVIREKRCRHFQALWQKIDPELEPEKDKYYAECVYAEKLKLQELYKMRQFPLNELF